MAWYDHEELKNPEHRSTRYKFTFSTHYSTKELQDEWDSLNETQRHEYIDVTPRWLLDQVSMHSGGAIGADSFFGACARAVGHRVIHHSFEGRVTKVPINEIYRHSQHDLEEATLATVLAAQVLQRNLGKDQYVKKLILRNSLIIKHASIVFAVGYINRDEIKGGTAWGVAIAAQDKIPTYVYDMNTRCWYLYILDDNKLKSIPVTGDNLIIRNADYAGIGSRKLTEDGEQAIKNLYVRYLNEKH